MINHAGIALIKKYEKGMDPDTKKILIGPALKAYKCPRGVWTIGWGHTSHVFSGMKISQNDAEEILVHDLENTQKNIENFITVPPNENQLAAMVCLAFNIGTCAFKKSTVLKKHNQSNFAAAGNSFSMWNEITDPVTNKKRISSGLTRRRADETGLYLSPVAANFSVTANLKPDVLKDPQSSSFNPTAISVGVGSAATVAQQAVANASSLWTDLLNFGINPKYLMIGLAIISIGALLYFLFAHLQRISRGER